MTQPHLAERLPPAWPFSGSRGPTVVTRVTSPPIPQISISLGQHLDRRPIFQAGHAGSIPVTRSARSSWQRSGGWHQLATAGITGCLEQR
jgi:hypothetical protein